MSIDTGYPFAHWDLSSAGFRKRAYERRRAPKADQSKIPRYEQEGNGLYNELFLTLADSTTSTSRHEYQTAMEHVRKRVLEHFPILSPRRRPPQERFAVGHKAFLARVRETPSMQEVVVSVPPPMKKGQIVTKLIDALYELQANEKNPDPTLVKQIVALTRTPLL